MNFWNCSTLSHSSTTSDVPVADPEPVVQPADRLGLLGDLRELVGPVRSEPAPELGRVGLELRDDQHTHV